MAFSLKNYINRKIVHPLETSHNKKVSLFLGDNEGEKVKLGRGLSTDMQLFSILCPAYIEDGKRDKLDGSQLYNINRERADFSIYLLNILKEVFSKDNINSLFCLGDTHFRLSQDYLSQGMIEKDLADNHLLYTDYMQKLGFNDRFEYLSKVSSLEKDIVSILSASNRDYSYDEFYTLLNQQFFSKDKKFIEQYLQQYFDDNRKYKSNELPSAQIIFNAIKETLDIGNYFLQNLSNSIWVYFGSQYKQELLGKLMKSYDNKTNMILGVGKRKLH